MEQRTSAIKQVRASIVSGFLKVLAFRDGVVPTLYLICRNPSISLYNMFSVSILPHKISPEFSHLHNRPSQYRPCQSTAVSYAVENILAYMGYLHKIQHFTLSVSLLIWPSYFADDILSFVTSSGEVRVCGILCFCFPVHFFFHSNVQLFLSTHDFFASIL